MIFSLIGLAYVVLSQAGTQAGLDWASDASYLGFLLALASGVLITLNIFSFSWAADMAGKAGSWSSLSDTAGLELFFITVVICISNIFTFPAKVAFSLAASEVIQLDVMLVGLLMGATIRVGSSILWRHANLITHALGINALGYAEPLFAVAWLALFWEVDIPRVDYLIIGTCAIISANILINSEVEVRPGFRAAILSLWATGTLIYFRNRSPFLEDGKYLVSVALLAGAFGLVLTLRTAPMHPLPGRHALPDHRRSESGRRSGRVPHLGNGFERARVLTMGLYGAAAAGLALIIRPALVGLAAWLIELLVVSFCTIIVASASHVFSSSRRRAKALRVMGAEESPRWSYPSPDRRHRRIEIWTSGVLTTGVLLSFVYLLWDKWLH